MMVGEIRCTSSSIPASVLSAFSSSALEAPSSDDVLPVMMRPSLSCMAAAGAPVRAAFSFAAATAGRSSGEMPAVRISSSALQVMSSASSPSIPLRPAQSVW